MWEQIRANKQRSAFLIAGMALVLIALGYAIGLAFAGPFAYVGIIIAAGVWLILFLVAMSAGRRILLGSMGAREIQHDDSPRLFNVVEEMTIASGLPKPPKVYVMDTDAPNAFAVGTPEESAVAVTSGLLMRLNRDELQGVVAHEVGHIINNDTKFMTHAGVMMAAIVIIADVFLHGMLYSGRGSRRSSSRGGGQAQLVFMLIAIVFAIMAPFLAQILYFACSRRREYLADACAARFTRYPEGLASALEKISGSVGKMEKVSRATAPMFIVNPLKGSSSAHSVFSTHPATVERVRILRSMAGAAGYQAYEAAYAGTTGKHLMAKETLGGADAPAARGPSAAPEAPDQAKAREAVDILHRMQGLIFLTCACGMKMKVPKGYRKKSVRCPACGSGMAIPAAILVAAGVAAAEAADAEEEAARKPAAKAAPTANLVYRFTPGKWNSFRCPCGKAIQLSPSFRASKTRCPACRREIHVKR